MGEPADDRTLAALARRRLDGSGHRARQFDREWFDRFDVVVALDRAQVRVLADWAASEADRLKVHLLLGFDPVQAHLVDVPDPYFSDAQMFDTVLGMIERSVGALFRQIEPAIRQGAAP